MSNMLKLKSITEIKIEENGDHDYHIHDVANFTHTEKNRVIYG